MLVLTYFQMEKRDIIWGKRRSWEGGMREIKGENSGMHAWMVEVEARVHLFLSKMFEKRKIKNMAVQKEKIYGSIVACMSLFPLLFPFHFPLSRIPSSTYYLSFFSLKLSHNQQLLPPPPSLNTRSINPFRFSLFCL